MDEPRIRFAVTGDRAEIAYTVLGEGPPLIVLANFLETDLSWRLTKGHWAPFYQRLAEDLKLVLFDWRGSGMSSRASEFSLENCVADVESVLDHAEIESCSLFTHLNSWSIAVALAATRPERATRLILGNPIVGGLLSYRTDYREIEYLVERDFLVFTREFSLLQFGWTDRGRDAAENMLGQWTGDTFSAYSKAIAVLDASARAGQVECEAMVLVSEQIEVDAPVRQRARQLAARFRNGHLVESSGLRTSPAVADTIKSFLGAAKGSTLDDALPASASVRPAAGNTVTILFTDIVDSTALTERLGDHAFRSRARELDAALRGLVRVLGGTPVAGKVLGDGVMATFASASRAIEAALKCNEAASKTDLRLHIGLHAGDVLDEGDNVYGGAVNMASRVCGLSAPGEVLVSETVRALARTSAGVRFEDRGLHELRGIEEPQRLFAVRAI